MHNDNLDDIVEKFNNKYHSTTKMKLVEVKSSIYFDFYKENNKEDHKFETGDHVRISKYKNIFAKAYTLYWSEDFVIKRVKNTVPCTYFVRDFKGEELVGTCYEKESQKINK